MKTLALVLGSLLLSGCALNHPKFTLETTTKDGTTEKRTLSINTFALWPATTDLAKQKASLTSKTFSLGTEGLKEDGGGTNVVEFIKELNKLFPK